MSALNKELVQRLARSKGDGKSIASLYLNVDGKQNVRPEDYQANLDAMIKRVSSRHSSKEVDELLERLANYVRNDFERKSFRGLAIVASLDGLWEVVPLPVPINDHLVVDKTPHMRRLENLLDEYETVGVLLTDKQKARFVVVELGHIIEREEITDPLPRHDDDKGDWSKDQVKTHVDAAVQAHLKRAAQGMFDLYQRVHFSHLLIAVADEMRPEVERNLHDWLRTKVIGRSNVPINGTDEEILNSVRKHSQLAERAQEARLVEKLRAAVGAQESGKNASDSPRGLAGVEATLQAVFEKRVETLLVSADYEEEGWRCNSCGYLGLMGRTCPNCNEEMELMDDIIGQCVDVALGQKCHVNFCKDADLDVMGRVGVLLRF